MAITQDQLNDVVQVRKTVLETISKGVSDEYLLATYNGLARYLDKRLPKIKTRVEGNTLKEETRSIVGTQRQAMGRKGAPASGKTQGSSQKSA